VFQPFTGFSCPRLVANRPCGFRLPKSAVESLAFSRLKAGGVSTSGDLGQRIIDRRADPLGPLPALERRMASWKHEYRAAREV
jgi:hypothetical protein